MKVYWHFRGGQTTRPYMIAVTRAEDIRPALEVFGEDYGCAFVRELTSPLILARPEVAAVKPGAVEMIYLDQLPSAYDRFRLPDGRWDYDAMDEAGVDVR